MRLEDKKKIDSKIHAIEQVKKEQIELLRIKNLPKIYRFNFWATKGSDDLPNILISLNTYVINIDGSWSDIDLNEDDKQKYFVEVYEFWSWKEEVTEQVDSGSFIHQNHAINMAINRAHNEIKIIKSDKNASEWDLRYLNAMEEALKNDWVTDVRMNGTIKLNRLLFKIPLEHAFKPQ
jgi:hypothetical protein